MIVGFLRKEFKRRVWIINIHLGVVKEWVEVEAMADSLRESMKSHRNSSPQKMNAPGEDTNPRA